MNNDPKRVQALLKPFGYRQEASGYVNAPPGTFLLRDWDVALSHFLEDKAKTGARMNDLAKGEGPYHFEFYSNVDADEHVALTWRHRHGLEDPRGSA